MLLLTQAWSLRTRLAVVACLSLLLGALPGALMLRGYAQQLDTAAQQHRALPANLARQAALARLQDQRGLAAEALSTRPDSKPQAVAAAQAATTSLAALDAALADGLPAALAASQRELVAALRRQQTQLAKAIADGPLDVPRLLAAQSALAGTAFAAIAELNAGTGLLLDADAASRFAIDAGLQAAPCVQDALSELAALARAAAVDDPARMSTAHTRYREHAAQMQQSLLLALQADKAGQSELNQRLAPLLASAKAQREQVDQTLDAAARDVNYPLDQLAARLAEQTRAESEQATEVGAAVRAIDAMTQQNAALVEQAAASADSLRAQAQGMDETVNAFRL